MERFKKPFLINSRSSDMEYLVKAEMVQEMLMVLTFQIRMQLVPQLVDVVQVIMVVMLFLQTIIYSLILEDLVDLHTFQDMKVVLQ